VLDFAFTERKVFAVMNTFGVTYKEKAFSRELEYYAMILLVKLSLKHQIA